MIRQTGGRAWGATSTRSRPASRAMRSASAVETMPTCSSLSLTSRIGEIRICSLWRKFVEMAQTPKGSRTPPTHVDDKAAAIDVGKVGLPLPSFDDAPLTLKGEAYCLHCWHGHRILQARMGFFVRRNQPTVAPVRRLQ